MKNKIEVLKQDVVIPDIVRTKLDDAYDQILREAAAPDNSGGAFMAKAKMKKRWIAIAAVAVLAVGSLTVGAAAHFNWFSPVEEELQITEAKKDALEKTNAGTMVEQSVTQNGVTVAVEQSISDANYFFAIISVEGITAPVDKQWLAFEESNISISGATHVNSYGQYIGVDQETGKMLYLWEGDIVDGDATEKMMSIHLENTIVCRPYTEEELEYQVETQQEVDNVLHRVDGVWEFSFAMDGSTDVLSYDISSPTGNPDIALEHVVITPLSIERSTQHVDPERMKKEWDDPKNGGTYEDGFYGFLMKDGTIYNASMGSGRGNFNEMLTGRIELMGFGTIIDVYQIEAMLFDDLTDDISVWDIENPTANDFVVVPLPTE